MIKLLVETIELNFIRCLFLIGYKSQLLVWSPIEVENLECLRLISKRCVSGLGCVNRLMLSR